MRSRVQCFLSQFEILLPTSKIREIIYANLNLKHAFVAAGGGGHGGVGWFMVWGGVGLIW